MLKNITFIGIVVGIILVGISAWFFLHTSTQTQTADQPGNFGTGSDRSFTDTSTNSSATPTTGTSTTQLSTKRIFKISDGPVAGATFVQTLRPTTTLARFVLADNGHVADLVLDSAGAVSRAVSNTTIPGVTRALWGEGGGSSIVQYLDGTVVKTAYLGFPATSTATSSLNRATRLQFLPDGIADVAVSPDGKNVAYILKTSAGVDGYTAKIDGAGSKKLFSLPLSEILISWPSQNLLLAQMKSAANVPGSVFSVNVSSGAVTPLLYAPGLSINADKSFSRVMYQTVGINQSSYIHDIESGNDIPLSSDPIPEKCAWSSISTAIIYCATPSQYVPPNYLDLWHQGAASVADTIVAFNTITGKSAILIAPGGNQGGVESDIVEMSQSIDGRYLLFIKKGDRSLWGVRLGQ
ncbi:hypothetical protein H7X87_04415 [Acetobacteraceae bacterium]|nr:hypothetical protein [Candidatus Parcubacteria bacterium]